MSCGYMRRCPMLRGEALRPYHHSKRSTARVVPTSTWSMKPSSDVKRIRCGTDWSLLAPKALVTVHIRKSTAQKLSSMLAFDPRSKIWAVAIRVGFDRDDAPVRSLFEAWGPRFYAALRFAMPATDNDVVDILDGDPENVIVLRRLPREAHTEITDAWFAANLVG